MILFCNLIIEMSKPMPQTYDPDNLPISIDKNIVLKIKCSLIEHFLYII